VPGPLPDRVRRALDRVAATGDQQVATWAATSRSSQPGRRTVVLRPAGDLVAGLERIARLGYHVTGTADLAGAFTMLEAGEVDLVVALDLADVHPALRVVGVPPDAASRTQLTARSGDASRITADDGCGVARDRRTDLVQRPRFTR